MKTLILISLLITGKPSFSDKITTTSNFVIYDNDLKSSDENEVVEKFNSYFSNIVLNLGIKEIANYSTCEDNIPYPVQMAIRKYSEHHSIVAIKTNCLSEEKHCFNTLSNHDILKVVSDIDVTKATSCQNIPTKIFKENIDLYIDVIGRIFKPGTIECKFPDRLKLADITPSYKKGVTDKNNYRPISLLPAISKVFEKLYYTQISNHMECYFAKFLCGIRRGVSTQYCLLYMIEKIMKALDNSEHCGLLVTDLSKAFDCVKVWPLNSENACL